MNNRHSQQKERCYRLAPCPAYDVEAMESWLSDLAQQGLLLAPDGFFAGIATLIRSKPCHAQYRLEAAQKSTSMWADDGGEPDPEQVALSAKYSWEYVAKRGDFYIYRCFDPQARELNTDPQVQALALNSVKKRQSQALFSLIFWLVLYPWLFLNSGPLHTFIHLGTWFCLLIALFVLWILADSFLALHLLRGLQKRLRLGAAPSDHSGSPTNWRHKSYYHNGKNLLKLLLGAFLLIIFLYQWGVSTSNHDKTPLTDYQGSIPFATLSDFGTGEVVSYQETMIGISLGFNCVKEWSDWLAPRCLYYDEHAQIRFNDGSILNAGLTISYYETASPWIAKQLALECYRQDQKGKDFSPLETPALAADFAVAYRCYLPTLVVQKGCLMIRAQFSQTGEEPSLSLAQWTTLLLDSILPQEQAPAASRLPSIAISINSHLHQ